MENPPIPALFESMLAHLPGMAYRCSHDARRTMLSVSVGSANLTGHAPQDLIGNRAAAYSDLINPEDRDHVAYLVAQSVERKEAFAATYRLSTPVGEKWVHERGGGVFDENGALVAIEGFIEDITDRKKLEQQFIEAQKFEVLGRLVGGIAHDFNNHLTVVNGYSKMLLKELMPDDPLRGEIQEIEHAGDLAATLTRQLLTFSRTRSYQPATVDMNHVVETASKLLKRLLGDDIDIEMKLAESLDSIHCDPAHIEQIVINLGVNAREDMPQGGKLTFTTANRVIDATNLREHPGARPGAHVMLAIADTGPGAQPTGAGNGAAPKSPLTTEAESRGAQLAFDAICGIVIESGGSYRVRPALPQGSIFEMFFPRTGAAPTFEEAKQPEVKSAIGSGHTILLVEDEKIVRNLIRRILAADGYAVLEAPSPEEAETICSNYSGAIHLVLSDVIMPKMTGPVLARKLLLVRPEMKVALMSGYNESSVRGECEGLTLSAFIEKPITPDVLLGKMKAVFVAAQA